MDSKTYTALTTVDTRTTQIYGFEVLLGIGTGCFVQAGYAVLLAILETGDMAFATSYMMLGKFLFAHHNPHITG
jgi:hypothetical protein